MANLPDLSGHQHKTVGEVIACHHKARAATPPALDVESTIAQLARDLQTTVLVGNPAPVVKEMDERMRVPHPGDLVWERTTRPGRVGILDAIEQEPVASEEDWDGDLPIPKETVYYVHNLNGEIERWVNADFLSLGPGRRLSAQATEETA